MGTGFEKDRVAWENGLPPYKHPGFAGAVISLPTSIISRSG